LSRDQGVDAGEVDRVSDGVKHSNVPDLEAVKVGVEKDVEVIEGASVTQQQVEVGTKKEYWLSTTNIITSEEWMSFRLKGLPILVQISRFLDSDKKCRRRQKARDYFTNNVAFPIKSSTSPTP
jgi:hypothetical protein